MIPAKIERKIEKALAVLLDFFFFFPFTSSGTEIITRFVKSADATSTFCIARAGMGSVLKLRVHLSSIDHKIGNRAKHRQA